MQKLFYRFVSEMEHVLDNPAWNALITGNNNLANGTETVRYFSSEVSPFVGFKETSADGFKEFYDLVPNAGPFIFIVPRETDVPPQWEILQCVKCLQMVYTNEKAPNNIQANIIPLADAHITKMLWLTKLTNPGPFIVRTINFGHYYGIFESDELVAMAGQRMNPLPYAEISAVCTHPAHVGKGYARQLLQFHAKRIKATGGIPFLHVKTDNERAIKVYESLGFTNRKEFCFYVIQKSKML